MADIPETQMVRVVNKMARPFTRPYANQPYTLPPGQDYVIPYHAACHFFGDPRAINLGDGKPEHDARRSEVRRLSSYYGTQNDPWFLTEDMDDRSTTDPDNGGPYSAFDGDGVRWHPNLPHVEVYDIADGSRIYTVLDDPEGDRVSRNNNRSRREERDLEKAVKMLQREIEKMKAEKAGVNLPPLAGTVDDAADLNEDPEIEETEAMEDLPPRARTKPATKKVTTDV